MFAKGWDSMALLFTIDDVYAPLGEIFITTYVPLYPTIHLIFAAAFEPTTTVNAGHVMEYLSGIKSAGARIVVMMASCVDIRAMMIAASRLDMIE
eukprot:3662166-Prorocentrum_lima.AAC.1